MSTTKPVKKWLSTPPTRCDICHKHITEVFIDGRTKMGPWAAMCEDCFKSYGVGLGVGQGQEYQLIDGDWVKTEG